MVHWLAVLPFAEAWLGVGSGEPRPDGFVLKVWWFLHPVMNADSVQPCVFPDDLRACHSWLHCCSAVWALTYELPMTENPRARKEAAIISRMSVLPLLLFAFFKRAPPTIVQTFDVFLT